MEEEIKDFLKSLGFSKSEIEIYLHLAKCGSFCPAIRIAKSSGVHRSNAYDTLRSLTEKGFVKEITEDNKKKFGAVHPDKIREYLKQRELEAESIVEKIKKISSNLSDNDEISLTRGCFAARQALLDLLKIRQEIKGYGFPKDAVFVLGEGFIDEFHRIREKEKIKMSLIVNDDVKKRMGLKNLKKSNVKYFPAEYSSKVSTFTCGDQVVKIVFGSPPCTVITTKGKEISNDNEFIFDFAWKYIDSGDKKLN